MRKNKMTKMLIIGAIAVVAFMTRDKWLPQVKTMLNKIQGK